jgi:hypothetical protein
MKKILILLLMPLAVMAADVKISQLPTGTAATTQVGDAFPYVANSTLVTKKMTIWDIANIPTLVSTYAPKASPFFTGTVTAPTFSGAFTGNATTATALAATPTACAANYYATTIAANGNLTCAQVDTSQLTGLISNAKLSSMANGTVKSNVSGSAGPPSDNTMTSLLDTFSLTQGSVLYRNAAIWTALSPGTVGQVLTSGGGSANLTWTTPSPGFINPMNSVGDLIVGGTAGAATRLGIGGNGQVLSVVSGAPSWAAAGTASPLTTKGDIYLYSTINDRLAVGIDNKIPTADSTAPKGLTYQYPNGKNYISNSNFESFTISNWSLGTVTLTNNFPSGVPTFGSGASANLNYASSSITPISGSASLNYSSSAADIAGDFIASNAFTIDSSDQARAMAFKFNYKPVSGTMNFSGTNANSFGVAIYDVTNSTWIQPAGVFNLVQGSGIGLASGTFQTSSNGTSYRLAVYNANATSGATRIDFDDFYVGPQITAIGAVVTDAISFVPTGTWTINTTYTGDYQRVGDSAIIRFHALLTGAPNAAVLNFNLPTGLVIDTTKLPTTAAFSQLGFGNTVAGGSGFVAYALYNNSTSITVRASNASHTSIIQTLPGVYAAGDLVSLVVMVPIVGWSSNVQMSSDTDTRVVQASTYNGSGAAQSISASTVTKVAFGTVNSDTHGAFDTVNSRYKVAVSGSYNFTGVLNASATASNSASIITLYKNGSALKSFNSGVQTGFTTALPFTFRDNAVAGDYYEIWYFCGASVTITTAAATPGGSQFDIARLSGPSVIAASERVAAQYYASAAVSPTTGNPINFDTSSFDTHSAVTVGASWKFTAPVNGIYSVSTSDQTSAGTPDIILYKNGVGAIRLFLISAVNIATSGSALIKLNAGDYIDLRPDVNATLYGLTSGIQLTSVSIILVK